MFVVADHIHQQLAECVTKSLIPPYPIIYSPAHNTVNQSPNRYFLYLIVVFLIELALDVSRLYLKEEMTE